VKLRIRTSAILFKPGLSRVFFCHLNLWRLHKKTRIAIRQTGFLMLYWPNLYGSHILRLGAFLAFPDRELDLLTLSQGLAAIHGDRTKMYEHITLTLTGDKPITFFVIEPFDCTHY
jgi:hypothetical protein